ESYGIRSAVGEIARASPSGASGLLGKTRERLQSAGRADAFADSPGRRSAESELRPARPRVAKVVADAGGLPPHRLPPRDGVGVEDQPRSRGQRARPFDGLQPDRTQPGHRAFSPARFDGAIRRDPFERSGADHRPPAVFGALPERIARSRRAL